ncbi:MAG TPA: family 1 glycosylhydrolase, partial [Ferruginibacter sp.]|nr:family 1 glycosylhydrolase [Ferruginibacter sp.]
MDTTIQNPLQPAVWGGIECTINRVNDNYFDQLQRCDFYNKPEQLEAMISLGIKTIRFPVLWEKHQPELGKDIDWSWADNCLGRLKENGITPVVGLLHHGSGPSFTDLLKPDFPELFAAYAAQVAKQFPWVTYYTPINEPLTTARFSGLYGLWYPHKKNDVSFVRILLNELKATVLAMQEIRKINPGARLVQTEDLGKTYSTKLLSYQSKFENQRRWLVYDILTGKFDNTHVLWKYFMRLGIKPGEMQFFLDNILVPDLVGVNHYITSERYLDERVDIYPEESVGGNGVNDYADVEAIRVSLDEPHGLKVLLREIWERYKIPLVITEAHLHCSREEQVRWLREVYETATAAKREGIDIRAVTAWALLGSFGWDKLLTCRSCTYETGAFDISAGYPRPTAIAALIRSLNGNGNFNEHISGLPGWWKRTNRFYLNEHAETTSSANSRPLVIIGKTGTLGRAFSRICKARNIHHFLLGREDVNICNSAQLEQMIQHYQPWAIVNATGYVHVDDAETEKERCYRENDLGVQKLAIECSKNKIKLVCFSSDMVFDGNKSTPYVEEDEPNAINTYGHSKQLAETFLSKVLPASLIIRTSSFFGPWDEYNFASHILSEL